MKTYTVTIEKTEGTLGLSKGKIVTRTYTTKVQAENSNEAEKIAEKEWEDKIKNEIK